MRTSNIKFFYIFSRIFFLRINYRNIKKKQQQIQALNLLRKNSQNDVVMDDIAKNNKNAAIVNRTGSVNIDITEV